MSSPDGRASSSGPWLLVLVLLAPAVVLPLAVGLYDRTDPTLAGFPFFFWFQFLLIIVSTLLTSLAYLVAARVHREDRVRRGLPPEPEGD